MFENLLYEKKDGIAYVTVNRPAVRNALNAQTVRELKTAFEQAKNDDEVRVVILTGSGDKAFVAGADINELATQTPVSGKDYALRRTGGFRFHRATRKAGDRGRQWIRARRRMRARNGVHISNRIGECDARPAGSEARHHSGIRRQPAACRGSSERDERCRFC